jgi:hypothetical protein
MTFFTHTVGKPTADNNAASQGLLSANLLSTPLPQYTAWWNTHQTLKDTGTILLDAGLCLISLSVTP